MGNGKETYKLPEGWIEASLDEIAILSTGNTPSKKYSNYYGGDFPFYKPSDLDTGIIYSSKEKLTDEGKSVARLVPSNTILVTSIGTIGKTGIVKKEGAFNQQINAIIPIISLPLFYYYQIQEGTFQRKLNENSSATTVSIINKTKFGKLTLKLAPLKEQQRIVTKIESLFSELDEAEKGLQKSMRQLEVYRQAVLKSAFNGKLTKDLRKGSIPNQGEDLLILIKKERQERYFKELLDWEKAIIFWEKHGKKGKKPIKPMKLKKIQPLKDKELDSLSAFKTPFKWVKIGEIASVKGGKRLPPKHSFSSNNTGLIYLMAGNLKDGTIKNELKYIKEETYEALLNYKVNSGDVYITIVGANIGESGVIPEKFDSSILTENAAKISLTGSVESKYISYWLNSTFAQLLIRGKIYSATLGKLGLGRVETIEIPLCHNLEQKAIVKTIDSQFSLIDQLAQTINSSLKRIEILKKSILKNAFEGKLVDSFHTDETASILLKRIKIEKENYLEEQNKIKKTAPKKIKKMEKSLSIVEVLKSSDQPILAQKVWQESKYNEDIAAFYAELKELGDKVVEIREGLDSFLSLKK